MRGNQRPKRPLLQSIPRGRKGQQRFHILCATASAERVGNTLCRRLSSRSYSPPRRNDRCDAWQADRPFVQTAWATHQVAGGDTVDLDYFHGSGLNTFWDGVRSGSSKWEYPDSQGLPTLVMTILAGEPNLAAFLRDFERCRKAHSNMVGFILGDELPAGSRRHAVHRSHRSRRRGRRRRGHAT